MARGGRGDAQALERKILEATVEYREGPWNRATKSGEDAAGLSESASLAFMALLERNGVEGARLVRLSSPRTNSIFDPDDVHFVVVVGEEAFDPVARRFEPDGPQVGRRAFAFVEFLWGVVEEVEVVTHNPSSVGADIDAASGD